jgi:hypothetical protein
VRGFSTQRTYETSIHDFDKVITVVQEHQERKVISARDLGPEGGLRLLTFRFRNQPRICIQVSPTNCILMLKGMKHDDYLSDMQIIRTFVKMCAHEYPYGVDLKLRTEVFGSKDKNEIIRQQGAHLDYLMNLLLHSEDPKREFRESLQRYNQEANQDANLHNTRAHGINSVLARFVLMNGLRCKPDGSLKLKVDLQRLQKSFRNYLAYLEILQLNLGFVTRFLDS